jgi:hypothetical protein
MGTTTNIKYTLRHSYFNDEKNFFYIKPSIDTYHVLSLVSSVESTFSNDDRLIHINFFVDDKSETYRRTYETFLDVLGKVRGA